MFDNLAMTLTVALLTTLLSLGLIARKSTAQEPAAPKTSPKKTSTKAVYEPTDDYAPVRIEGWTVLVNKKFRAREPELADRTLALMRRQLGQIVNRLPAAAVKKLRTIRIWIEENEPHTPCMTYHPDPEWLRANDMNPEKARCVELSNARNFLKWTHEQPWMVLHELSHGYHHQILPGGFNNAEISAAYAKAMKSKRYDSVLRYNGKKERAYAATNCMEYFAEASEAYFGINDFYPVNRADLKHHDPEVCALLGRLWGDKSPE
jgi:hypothetical protein